MTDEDKTGSYESHEEPTVQLVIAAIGTVLLVAVGVLTFVIGLLSPLITDGCPGGGDYGADGPAGCRDSQIVARMLTVPVLLVLPAGLLLTWLRFAPPYRPRAWVPPIGLAVIGVLWLVANSLLEGRLF